MRAVGYILLVLGFVCAAYVPLSAGPLLRAMESAYRRELIGPGVQQSYSANDVISARMYGANDSSRLARLGSIGTVLMLAGGVVLDRAARRRTTPGPPPVIRKT